MTTERKLKIHYIQHVPYEGIGKIRDWVTAKKHNLTGTHLFLGERISEIDDPDWLVIMGGPMGVHDIGLFPWLREEKQLIKRMIDENRVVLGICLGAQLIADVLGANVKKNLYKEIGWFKVYLTKHAEDSKVFSGFPKSFYAFHWHSETFDLPKGALPTASSDATHHQAFVFGDNIVGIQFHLETTEQLIKGLIKNCGFDLTGTPFVQTEHEILSKKSHLPNIHSLLFRLLDNLEVLTYERV